MKKISLIFLCLFSLTALSENKKTYDEYAAKNPNVNDVKAMVYSWFASLDHQSDIYWFFPNLAEGFSINFEGMEPITTKDGLDKWYDNVKSTIEWNVHHIDGMKIEVKGKSYAPSQFIMDIILTWEYENYDKRDRYLTRVAQTWDVIVNKDNKLQLRKLTSTIIDETQKK